MWDVVVSGVNGKDIEKPEVERELQVKSDVTKDNTEKTRSQLQ